MAGEFVKFIDQINSEVRNERNMRVALTTVMSAHKPRIFEKGQDANRGQIGTYGTKPISISKAKQARNTGQTYFPGGYAQYHGKIGKGSSKVILRNTDQMYMDYQIVSSGSGFGFGFQNSFNSEKAGWMTDKYDKEIFQISDEELDLLGNVLVDQLNKAIG